MSYDLIIKNGKIFDGLGSPPRLADLAIQDGKIVAIAQSIRHPAKEVIDAQGLWVTPGFIDIHTHYDIEVEVAPGLSESVRHGVTTVVMGNCSLSLTLGKPSNLAEIFQRVETLSPHLIKRWLAHSVSWQTPSEYLDHLKKLQLGPNVAPLLGHSALRAHVMGLERSLHNKATDEEILRMKQIATSALEAGCIGISIDMVPWHMMSGEFKGRTIPSQHAGYREYAMLADLCRTSGKVFQVTPNPQNLISIGIIFWLSLGGFRGFFRRKRLRITILSALDSVAVRPLWLFFPTVLFIFNRLLGCNIRFQTLTQPFTVYSDGPITPVFEEFKTGVELNDQETREGRIALWRNEDFKNRFRQDWLKGPRKTFHCDLGKMKVTSCPDPSLVGRTFNEIAQMRGSAPVDEFMSLLEAYDDQIRWMATGANDRDKPRYALMKHPEILPGFTDAGAHVRNLGYYDGALSLLRQSYKSGFITIEKAISRVTGEASRWFGLDTGVIHMGAKADLVLLNPNGLKYPIPEQVEIKDPLLNDTLRLVKRGSNDAMKAVFISGKMVVKDGIPLKLLGTESLGTLLSSSEAVAEVDRSKIRLRNRINDQIIDHPFTDYWDIFVLKHQKFWNIGFHMMGVVLFYGILATAFFQNSFQLLWLLPTSQMVGLIGHWVFEKSHIDTQDAVFSVRASRCLNRMFVRVITGKYSGDILRTREMLRTYQQGAAT